MIEITDYLTEDGLAKILEKICLETGNVFINRQVKIPPLNRMPFDIELLWLGKKTFVEFDGYYHYQDAKTIYNDELKNNIIEENKYDLIRIPYWVQLDTESFKHYFNFDYEIKTSFPHGFIDSKALLPASFCRLGFLRFEKELEVLSATSIPQKVIDSLYSKAKKIPIEYIYK